MTMMILIYLAAALQIVSAYTFFLWPFVFLYVVLKMTDMVRNGEREMKAFSKYFFLAGLSLLFLLETPSTISMLLEGFW